MGCTLNRRRVARASARVLAAPFGVFLWLGHFHDYERAIVSRMDSAREPVCFFKEAVGDTVCRQVLIRGDEPCQAVMPKEFSRRVLSVPNTIGMKHHDVARIENETSLVIGDVLEHPEGKPCQANRFAATAMEQKRLFLPCVGHPQSAAAAIPCGKAEGHESTLNEALAQKSIHGT